MNAANIFFPVAKCDKYPDPKDICKYMEYNVVKECLPGLIFDRKECKCVPGISNNLFLKFCSLNLCSFNLYWNANK